MEKEVEILFYKDSIDSTKARAFIDKKVVQVKNLI